MPAVLTSRAPCSPQTSDGSVLSLHFSYFLLNTSSERLLVRDGPFSNSELLLGGRGETLPPPMVSSRNLLLMEYSGGPEGDAHPAGGFLASVAAVGKTIFYTFLIIHWEKSGTGSQLQTEVNHTQRAHESGPFRP